MAVHGDHRVSSDRKAERRRDASELRGGGATIGATPAVAEDNTPFRYNFRYPVLATVFLERDYMPD